MIRYDLSSESNSAVKMAFNPLIPRAAYLRQCLCHHWSKKWLGANPFLGPMLTSHGENAKEQSYVK